MKFLSDLSDHEATPVYPVASPSMSSAVNCKRWEIHPLHYSLGYCSAALVALIRRLRGLNSPDHAACLGVFLTPSKLQHHCNQTTNSTVDPTNNASQDDPHPADNRVNHEKKIHDNDIKDEDPFEAVSNVTRAILQLDGDDQNDKLYDSDGDNLHVFGNSDTQNPFSNEGKGPSDVTGSSVQTVYDEDPEDDGISVYRDPQTGRYFTSEYDPNEDPGMSIQLEIPGEEILVTPEMLQSAEALCAEQEVADTLAVSAVLTYGSAWAEITQRAISIGRLSPLAFATLARQYLTASNRHLDEHLLYWKHQQVLINKADHNLQEAILKVKRDNKLLVEIKGKTVDMAEILAANQQKELMASNLAEVHEPKPDLC